MNPIKLRNLFIMISLIGLLIIIGFSYQKMSSTFEHYNISSAQKNSKNLGHVLYKIESHTLIDQNTNKLHLKIPNQLFKSFDKRMRQLLKPSGAIKIKIFSLDAQIIYSTDLQIIGLIDDKNMSLKKAIKGEITSDIQHRNSFVDLNNERKFDVDVVGTYLPMLDSSGQIKGVYEIYMDMTPYIKSGDKVIQTQIMSLGFILLVIFVLLNVLIFISTNKMLKLQSKLQHQATHDELTNINNRAYINERLKEELARIKRSNITNKTYQTGLALIDIDYFKEFNDNHGHLLGDEILKAFATRLQDIMRQEDVVARYGGEEFIVILPNTDADELLVATKRIHEWLKSKPYMINGKSYNIKTSIGVTQILTSDDSISSIIKRADMALYYIKEHGRDNVMQFSSNNSME